MESGEDVSQNKKHPDEWYLKLRDCLKDKNNSDFIRRKVVKALVALKSKTAELILLECLEDWDETLRYEVIRGLNQLRKVAPVIDLEMLIRQLSQEIKRYEQTEALARILENYYLAKEPSAEEKALFLNAIQSLHRESLEKIFRVLALFYPPNLIHLIHDRFREGDDYVRANAAELLDNLFDKKVEKILLPVIEREGGEDFITRLKNSPQTITSETFVKILKGHDIWLKLVVMFTISHYKLSFLYDNLKEMTESGHAVLKGAAHLAYLRVKESARCS